MSKNIINEIFEECDCTIFRGKNLNKFVATSLIKVLDEIGNRYYCDKERLAKILVALQKQIKKNI